MKTNFKLTGVSICVAFTLSCQKDDEVQPQNDLDKFFISTVLAHNSNYTDRTWYVGTFKDLSITDYTLTKAMQRPDDVMSMVRSYKDFVFVLPYNRDKLPQVFVCLLWPRHKIQNLIIPTVCLLCIITWKFRAPVSTCSLSTRY